MSRIHLLPVLGIAAAVGCGSALAQTGTTPQMPDTSGPSEPAQQMSPSSDAAGSADMSSDSSSGGKSATHHKKTHKKSKTPKPAENDNNAMPNSTAPSPAPKTQSPQ